MTNLKLNLDPETQLVTVTDSSPTISVIWDRAVQTAIIETASGPTIASRAYGMVHTAIYDAWSAYEDIPISTNLGDELQRPQEENTIANKTEATSYAAYHVLIALFPDLQENFAATLEDLGYDPDLLSTDDTSPAGIGYIAAQALLDYREEDGANQLGNEPNGDGIPYSDYTDYQSRNQFNHIVNIEFWTPEPLMKDDKEYEVQTFLTPQWGNVTPFALESGEQFRPQPPQPFLLVDGEVNLEDRTILLANGSVIDISPDIVGTIINPEFIIQAEEVIDYSANLTDKQKLIAEFWEDGSGTSFPPGTWMTFGQYVSARDDRTLDDDVVMFFTLGNALFDAGVAAWESKVYYDYTRPVTAIATLGELGLIGEFDPELNGYAIAAYGGVEEGTKNILGTDFTTYQTPNADSSPPFAEYTSGHSAFSAAGAAVLSEYTDSDYFGASIVFDRGESRFEPGVTPSKEITLEWNTFSDAADEAGISRLYGGIHFEEGDLNGRELGETVANTVIEQAQFYIEGGDTYIEEREATLDNINPHFQSGTEKDDLINGDRKENIIFGGLGNDTIDGEKGNDLLRGGLGRDVFAIGRGNGTDRLFDYQDGSDRFWLTDGLTWSDLNFQERSWGTAIVITETNECSILVYDSTLDIFDESDFLTEIHN